MCFQNSFLIISNKVFIKYSDNQIRRYNLDLIYNLCKKSNVKNKESLLYQTLIFHDLILYNCGNNDFIKPYERLIEILSDSMNYNFKKYQLLKIFYLESKYYFDNIPNEKKYSS